LAKLHFYIVRGTAANWFRSCLTNIKQKVEIKPPNATPNFFFNWGTVTHGILFITYINDLPSTIRTLSEPIIFADDTNVIISNKSIDDFRTLASLVLSHMTKWLTANKLALSLNRTKLIKSVTNNSLKCALSVGYNGKYGYRRVSKYKIPWSTN
jgi:hypothetical protein